MPPSAVGDSGATLFQSLITTNGDIFDLDWPGCPLGTNGILHTAECYDNFYEYVTLNLGDGDKVCSNTNTYSYESQINTNAIPQAQVNLISTSLISIPANSIYSPQ